MKPSPDLKPKLWDGLVVLLVILLAAGTAAAAWGGSTEDLTVSVSIDGEEFEHFPLTGEGVRTYTAGGYTLCVTETAEGIAVTQSDCPTQDCVHTGVISRSGQSIVCLPARLSVTLTGGDDGVDAVIG